MTIGGKFLELVGTDPVKFAKKHDITPLSTPCWECGAMRTTTIPIACGTARGLLAPPCACGTKARTYCLVGPDILKVEPKPKCPRKKATVTKLKTRTVKCPTLLGKRVRLGRERMFGGLCVLVDTNGRAFWASVGDDDSPLFLDVNPAVRWAERRILATARALDKARGKGAKDLPEKRGRPYGSETS